MIEQIWEKSGIITLGTMISGSHLKGLTNYAAALLLSAFTWEGSIDLGLKVFTGLAAILASVGAFVHYWRLAELNKLKAEAIKKAIDSAIPKDDE